MSDAMRDALKAVSSWSRRIPGSDDYRMPKSAMVAVDAALATAPTDATKLARDALEAAQAFIADGGLADTEPGASIYRQLSSALSTAPGESEGARDAIPEGVYYNDGNFYDCRTHAGMGFTFWNRWRHRAESFPPAPPAAPAGEAGMREWPAEITPPLREILGIMNFMAAPIAHVYQAAGFDMKKRAEDEQAFVLHRLLGHWFAHGDDWRKHANAELQELAAKARALAQETSNG